MLIKYIRPSATFYYLIEIKNNLIIIGQSYGLVHCFSKWAAPPLCGRWNESGGAVAASSKIGGIE